MIRKKFAWRQDNPVPPEWFDLDRSEKMIKNAESYRLPAPEEEAQKMYPPCPDCGSGNVIFRKLIRSRWFQLFAGYKCEDCKTVYIEREHDNFN
jgi:transposase-like protein